MNNMRIPLTGRMLSMLVLLFELASASDDVVVQHLIPLEKLDVPVGYKYGFKRVYGGDSIESKCDAIIDSISSNCKRIYFHGKTRFCDWNDFVRGYYAYFGEIAIKHPKKYSSVQKINADEMSYCYLRRMCYFLRHNLLELQHGELKHLFFGRIDYKLYCPHPCEYELRCEVPHARSSLCTNYEYAYYEDDYNCTCVSPYEWDSANKSCIANNPCIRRPCHSDETCIQRTHISKASQLEGISYKCVKTKYYRDNCENDLNDLGLKGTKACENGQCIPLENKNDENSDTALYRCKCNDRYANDESVSYPNCYKRISKCWRFECKNGQCKVDANAEPICVCFDGWKGPKCEEKKTKWLAWTEWTECMPNCTMYPMRQRFRECSSKKIVDCMDGSNAGQDYAYENCPSNFCFVNGTWTEWTAWSQCSLACGKGNQTSSRLCIYDPQALFKPNGAFLKIECGGAYHRNATCIGQNCEWAFSTASKVTVFAAVVILSLFLVCSINLWRRENKLQNKFNLILSKYELNESDADFILKYKNKKKHKQKLKGNEK